jgi:hypothetical protein
MNWAKSLFRYFSGYLDRWLNSPYQTRIVQEYLPKQLDSHTLYIVQDGSFFEQAAMICPCGCKKILHMNLLSDEHPYWKFIHHKNGTASLHPSVWRQKDCGSHFWFKHSRVQWV